MSEVKGVLGKGKKIQSLNLVGRREGTVMVLSETVANFVRDFLFSHAPSTHPYTHPDSSPPSCAHSSSVYMDSAVLARPTRYLVEYAVFKMLPSTPGATKGALVVIKNARDVIFGVWMGDGLWLERGGYYGSGES
jgi:hypothetical protein